MTYIVRQVRARRLCNLLADQHEFYLKGWTADSVLKWQLDRFNAEWRRIQISVPYFQTLRQQKKLPSQFSTWDEFKQTMPVMDRAIVQQSSNLSSAAKLPDYWRTTGGSTAEPLQIPAWDSEREFATKDLWYARSWFDVAPSDKLFLLWGHSHLLGEGLHGWLNGARRQIKDRLLGYFRYSAYDMSEPSLRRAAEAMLAFKPAYIIAYAMALDRFVRVNQDLRADFHKLKLKVAIATGESFPNPDSARLIAEVLGSPVAMEYGSIETGPIAHQRLQGEYSVFWRHHFLEGYQSEYLPGAYEILITSLYPRCFPLVRYRIGDLILPDPNHEHFNQSFKAVIGRCNDYVVLESGCVLHSEAFTHAIKDFSSILGYQVTQLTDGAIILNYISAQPLELNDVAEIRRRLQKINSDLAAIRIFKVESLCQTIAGKTRRIRRE